MDIIKIKKALYAALQNDFAIYLDADSKYYYRFSFYPLHEVCNGLLYVHFEKNGKINAGKADIDFQYLRKTKKAEKLITKFCAALDGCTAEEMKRIFPIFEYYSEKFQALYNAKYSQKIELYTESDDIKPSEVLQ